MGEIPFRERTTPAVRKARRRKLRNRALKKERLEVEAAKRGITVQQLVTENAQEVNRIIQERQFVPPAPEPRHRRGYYDW